MMSAALTLVGLLALASGKPQKAVKITANDMELDHTSVSHIIQVRNAKHSGIIVAVEIGRSPGLENRPVRVTPPKGWEMKVVETTQAGGDVRAYLHFSCPPGSSGACIGPGESRSFIVVMQYRSASLYGPVVAVFANGDRLVVEP